MAEWVVDTWVWNPAAGATDTNYVADLTVNETAPADFNPAAVSAVALSVANVTGSGFGDDRWHGGSSAGAQIVGLFTAAGTSLASNVGTVPDDTATLRANVTADVVGTTGSGGTINGGATKAQWEGAKLRLSGAFGTQIQWAEYDKTKGGDGTTLTGGAVTMTITYTPAAAAVEADPFSMVGAGALTAAGENVTVGAATLAGAGTLAPTGQVFHLGVAALAGAGVLTATPETALPTGVVVAYDGTSPFDDASYITTPDRAEFDVSGDLDVRIRIRLADYTDTSDTRLVLLERYGGDAWNGTTPEEQWMLLYDPFDGRVEFYWRDSGGTETVQTSPTAGWQPSPGDVLDIRAVMDVDVSGINYALDFYTRVNPSVPLTQDTGWTSRGQRTGAVTSFQATDQPVQIMMGGTFDPGASPVVLAAAGFAGLTSSAPVLFDPYFEDGRQTPDGGDTFIDSANNVWTVAGTAAWNGTPDTLPFIDEFTGTDDDPPDFAKWPVLTGEGDSQWDVSIQSNRLRGQAGNVVDDFAIVRAAQVTSVVNSEGRIRVAPVAGTHNEWLYLVLRSSGEIVPGNAGRPATAYYFRFALSTAQQESVDYLYRRINDTEANIHTLGPDTNTNRNPGEPFFFRWELYDDGSYVTARWKMWDCDDPEPTGWDSNTDTTPGALLGASGPVALLWRNYENGQAVQGTVDEFYYDALQAPQALPVADTFAGANGDRPDYRLWDPYRTGPEGGGAIDIQGNKLRLLADDTSGRFATVVSRTEAQGDAEVLVLIDPSNVAVSGNSFFYVLLRSSGDPGSADGHPTTAAGLFFHVGNTQTGTTDRLYRVTSGSGTLIGSNFSSYRNAGEPFYVRLQVVDSGSDVVYRFKGWDADGSEPGSWQYEYTDTTPGATAGATGVLQLLTLDWITDASDTDVRVDSVTYEAVASGVVTGAATLAGAGTITATATVVPTGQATLAGAGVLAATATVTATGAATVAGAGALTGAGEVVVDGAGALAGAGTLAAAGEVVVGAGATTIAGTGTLSVAGASTRSGIWSATGAGVVAVAGNVAHLGNSTATGTGTLTATGGVVVAGAATLAGVGVLAAAPQGDIQADPFSLIGTGTLTVGDSDAVIGGAVLHIGAGGLAAAGEVVVDGGATTIGSGSLTVAAAVVLQGTATLAGTGVCAAAGETVVDGTGALAGQGTLDATGAVTIDGAATLSGTGALAAQGDNPGAATLVGTGTLTAAPEGAVYGEATLAGQGTLSVQGTTVYVGAYEAVGTGTLAATAITIQFGAATLAGAGTLSAAPDGAIEGAATLSGTGTVNSVAHVAFSGALDVTGAGTLGATGTAVYGAQGALQGNGALVAVAGALAWTGEGTLFGAGALAAAGSRILTGAATLVGEGTLTGATTSFYWQPQPIGYSGNSPGWTADTPGYTPHLREGA